MIFLFMAVHLAASAPQPQNSPRGLWITTYQDPPVLSSAQEMDQLIAFAKKANIETLYLQVYRGGKAWFPTPHADDSPYREIRDQVGGDAIRLFITKAHIAGLRVFAWMNLLSLSTNEQAPILKKYGADVLTRNVYPKEKLSDFKIDNQYFLEPGDLRVRYTLSRIVETVVTRYPELDGIQFDYIRYPDHEPYYGYATMNLLRFQRQTGKTEIDGASRIWKDWKRQQVNQLVRLLSYKVRLIRPDMRVAASVLAPYSRAYHEAFQEWNLWLKSRWIDYVIVMSYSPQTDRVQQLITDAQKQVDEPERVSFGIWAEDAVKVKELEVFSHQMRVCEGASLAGCVVLDYESFSKSPGLVDALVSQ